MTAGLSYRLKINRPFREFFIGRVQERPLRKGGHWFSLRASNPLIFRRFCLLASLPGSLSFFSMLAIQSTAAKQASSKNATQESLAQMDGMVHYSFTHLPGMHCCLSARSLSPRCGLSPTRSFTWPLQMTILGLQEGRRNYKASRGLGSREHTLHFCYIVLVKASQADPEARAGEINTTSGCNEWQSHAKQGGTPMNDFANNQLQSERSLISMWSSFLLPPSKGPSKMIWSQAPSSLPCPSGTLLQENPLTAPLLGELRVSPPPKGAPV